MALGGWRRDRVLACDAMISACRKEVGIERDSGLVSSVQCLAGGGGGGVRHVPVSVKDSGA